MTWKPQVMRHRIHDGSVEYAIHDVYYDEGGRPTSWTEHARSPRFPSVDNLRDWVDLQLRTPDVGVICGDLGYEHNHTDFELWRAHLDDPPIDYSS